MTTKNTPSILIVEDEESIRRFIAINLERNNFIALEASSGEEALEIISKKSPDLVILDIMLPGMDGFAVCRKLRDIEPSIAVIMLTARGQDIDKIMGLELGADDYLVKPFNPLELVARIRAVLRRIKETSNQKDSNTLFDGPYKLDIYSQRLYKDEIEIELTPREFNLMKIFIENKNKAFNRDELLNICWGEDFFGDPKTVDVHIRRLREKIEDDPSKPLYIETVWGLGYRWREAKE